jgi:HlyD family secretion protein
LKKISDELFEKRVETKVDNKRFHNDYLASIKKEKFIYEQYQRKWNAELVMLKQENVEFGTQMTQLEEEIKKYTIIAPIEGEVMQVAGIQENSYVPSGFQFAQISPKGKLIIECFATPYDIGFLHEGMQANFQLDAFNYNQWGMAKGLVKEISSDIVYVNNQPVFKVRCSIQTTYLQLKNGYKSDLKKGMTLTGRFTITERTLAQLIFDKLDNWLNPKLVNN